MSAHDIADLAIIGIALGLLVLVSILIGERSYWKRIARLHENARCDAQDRVGDLQRACDALRRALGRLEREDSDGTA